MAKYFSTTTDEEQRSAESNNTDAGVQRDETIQRRDQDTLPDFLRNVLSLPVVRDSLTTASEYYQQAKARFRNWNMLFEVAEHIARTAVDVTNRYVAVPLVGHVGGWHVVDRWACMGLERLEDAAPIITKPTEEIKEALLLKVNALFEEDNQPLPRQRQATITEVSDNDEEDVGQYGIPGGGGLSEDDNTFTTGMDTTTNGSRDTSTFIKGLEGDENIPRHSSPNQRSTTGREMEDYSVQDPEASSEENLQKQSEGTRGSPNEKASWWKRFLQRIRPPSPNAEKSGSISSRRSSISTDEKLKEKEDKDEVLVKEKDEDSDELEEKHELSTDSNENNSRENLFNREVNPTPVKNNSRQRKNDSTLHSMEHTITNTSIDDTEGGETQGISPRSTGKRKKDNRRVSFLDSPTQ